MIHENTQSFTMPRDSRKKKSKDDKIKKTKSSTKHKSSRRARSVSVSDHRRHKAASKASSEKKRRQQLRKLEKLKRAKEKESLKKKKKRKHQKSSRRREYVSESDSNSNSASVSESTSGSDSETSSESEIIRRYHEKRTRRRQAGGIEVTKQKRPAVVTEPEVVEKDQEKDVKDEEKEPEVSSEVVDEPKVAVVSTAVEEKVTSEDAVTGSEILKAAGKITEENSVEEKQRGTSGVGDYGAAYRELFEQLCSRMVHRILKFFYKLYRTESDEAKVKQKLIGIQKWNQDTINAKAAEFLKQYKDIIRYFRLAYAANVLVMSVVIQRDERSTDIEIDCPQFSIFCHRCYVETARRLFDNVGILDSKLPAAEKLTVYNALEHQTKCAVASSLRLLVPIHKIAPIDANDEEQYDSIHGKTDVDGLDLDEDDMQEIVDEEEEGLKAAELDVDDIEESDEDSLLNGLNDDNVGTEDDSDLGSEEDSADESEEYSDEYDSEDEHLRYNEEYESGEESESDQEFRRRKQRQRARSVENDKQLSFF